MERRPGTSPQLESRWALQACPGGEAPEAKASSSRLADTPQGNRPSFSEVAAPKLAEPFHELFTAALRGLGVPVQAGVFGARMRVALVNDGPVTIVLDV